MRKIFKCKPKPYYESKLGQLYHGDCLDIMPWIDNVDMVLTSPPYDNLRDYKGYAFDFEKVARSITRLLVKGGVIVWVVGDETKEGSETGTSFKQALFFMRRGLNLHDTMIYKKVGFAYPEVVRYYPIFEYMFVFSNGRPKTINLIADRVNVTRDQEIKPRLSERQVDGTLKGNMAYKTGKRSAAKEFGVRSNIWEYLAGFKRTEHPASFPELLAQDHIISWSNENDIILDPLCGSGTTCKMAEQLGRRWVGIEISEKYCEVAAKRIRDEAETPKLF